MNTPLRQVAQVLLFDPRGKLLIYLRDDKPGLPFANHWDLFGGHIEAGETPVQALVREVREEIGVELTDFTFFRTYETDDNNHSPNIKYTYYARIDQTADELTLHEGQRLDAIDLSNRGEIRWANVLGMIVDDFAASGLAV